MTALEELKEELADGLIDKVTRRRIEKAITEIICLQEALENLLSYAEEGCPDGGYVAVIEARAAIKGFRVIAD
jgi:hypothetical protein